jgi:malate synthase
VEEEILNQEAKKFLNKLSNNFSSKINELVRNRSCSQFLDFHLDTKDIREGDWVIPPPPKEIENRKVEITGPPVRKMVINALNSGANVYMADFEDSNCPSWSNNIQGQINLRDAVDGTIEYIEPKNNKKYLLNKETAVLFVRPRGLHLVEKNYLVNGSPIPACLFDYGLYLFHNYKNLLKKGSRPYFYLPKLEHYTEAALWNEVFSFSEELLGIDAGTIKATVLIETLPAAFQMNEILYELRTHSAGLNCGRWDYIFSFIKEHKNNRQALLPDREQIGMNQHFMRSYSLLLVQTCHRRGVHAMGGMAAQIPIKNDDERNATAMAKVRADKLREVQDGHDGTWVAHPGLIPVAREVFDLHMPQDNQIGKEIYLNKSVQKQDLLSLPVGVCTEEGLRKNINICFQYLNAWINGNGCVPINHLMEDAATAEISRAQIWQWKTTGAWLTNGMQVTELNLKRVVDEEIEQFENLERFDKTKKIFTELCFSKNLVDFLTPLCYDTL